MTPTDDLRAGLRRRGRRWSACWPSCSATTAPQDGRPARHARSASAARGRSSGRTSCARRRSRATRSRCWRCSRRSFPSLQKMFEQADCHIKPSTLFGIGLLLAVVGAHGQLAGRACRWFFAAARRARACSSLPFALAVEQAARAAEEVRRASCPTPWSWWPGPCGPATAWRPACTSSPRKCPSPIADEFGRVYEEQNLGIPIEDALQGACASACPTSTCASSSPRWRIQRQTGGDLAEILDKIGYVIRERYPHPGPGEGADRRRPAVAASC